MLIDINKIVVGDRIRKDFGDIEGLADSIKKLGLLNPLTINREYKLLAGERRLRACKSLGMTHVEVNMVDTEDEEQDLEVEMSENNKRLNFTGSELAEGIRRQMAIEQEKARQRMLAGKPLGNVSQGFGRASDLAGAAFGISGKQAEKVVYVDDHRDLLDPADFADWDEGKLSTNKAFQKVKAAQKQAEQERNEAYEDLEDAYRAKRELEEELECIRSQPKPEPEVIEREVVREVVPDDYNDLKRKVGDLKHEKDLYLDTNKELRNQLESTRKELDQAKDILGMDKSVQDVRRDVQYLISATNSYVRRYGGLTWTVDRLNELDADMREQFRKAILNLATFSNALMESMNYG